TKAAAPDADLAVLTSARGAGIVGRLRQALSAAPAAQRFVIHLSPPSLAGEGQRGGDGDYPISVLTLPITDTCKEVVDGLVRATVPRESLVEVRGPWLITREGLADALVRAVTREDAITDMLSLCEAAGVRVRNLPMK